MATHFDNTFLSKKRRHQTRNNTVTTTITTNTDQTSQLIDIYSCISLNFKQTCSTCYKDISHSIQIYTNTNKYLCLHCFIHNKNNSLSHNDSYHIINKLSFPLFTPDWSIYEELMLLSLIEKNGLDNWEDISDALGTKNAYECESHYYTFYYTSSTSTQPSQYDLIINFDSVNNNFHINNERVQSNISKYRNKYEEVLKNKGTIPNIAKSKQSNNTLTCGNSSNNNNNNNTISNTSQKQPSTSNTNNTHPLHGYWPKRGDFDIEYLNDAENDIADLEFLDEDTDEDKALKLKMLELYNQELNEREKRKEFVIEHNLIDIRKQMQFEKKLQRDDREIYNCLKPFARFLSPNEFQDFFEGIVIEKNLRARINQLKQYKAQGCKTYEDVEKASYNDKRIKNKKGIKEVNKNINAMIAETCGIGENIKNFLVHGITGEDKVSDENKFIERVGLSKEDYESIKKQIAIAVLEERNCKGNINGNGISNGIGNDNNNNNTNAMKCLDNAVDLVFKIENNGELIMGNCGCFDNNTTTGVTKSVGSDNKKDN